MPENPFFTRIEQVSKLMLAVVSMISLEKFRSYSPQKSLSSVLPKPQRDLPTVKAGVVNAHLDKNIVEVSMDPQKIDIFHTLPSTL